MKFIRTGLLLLLIIVITACSTPPSTPTAAPVIDTPVPQVQATQAVGDSYPSPEAATSYPGPTPENTAVPSATPTQDAALGSVTGSIYLKGKPVNQGLLFLSDILKDTEGKESVVSVDYNTRNRAETTKEGVFTFVNIPPGRYALVIVVIPDSYVLLNPDKQEAITVTIEAGKNVDLGKLDFEELPIPAQ